VNEQTLSKTIGTLTDSEIVALLRKKFADDIHLFARQCITEDPHDQENPVKHLPVDLVPYIDELLEAYVTEPKILVEKSRQVMVSWIFLTAILWDVLFHPSRRVAIVSKKTEDARKLIERMQFMYEQLPVEWRPKLDFAYHPLPKVTCGETHSQILGIPQGAEQLRSDTFSVIFSDELAFQDDQEKTWTASKPTIDGGGTFIAVSTPNGENNLFYQLRKGGSFKVFTIHYSMNPLKTDAWRKQAFSGLKKEQIDQEYEINYLASQSDKVTPEFSAVVHVRSLEYNNQFPLYVSWDFGYNRPAVSFSQYYDGSLRILKSYLGYKIPIDQFVDQMIVQMNQWFSEITTVVDFCDIAGKQANDQTGKTTIQVVNRLLAPHHRNLRYKKTKNLDISISMMRKLMTSLVKGYPAMLVDPSNKDIIAGFQGGYHYHGEQKKLCGCGLNEFGEKEKNYYTHLIDTVRYVVEHIYGPVFYNVHRQPVEPPRKVQDKRFTRSIRDQLNLGRKF